MAGVVVDRVSHAILAHRLANGVPARDISALPSILEMMASAVLDGLPHGHGGKRIATHRRGTSSSYRLVDFNRDSAGPIDMPRLAANVRRDADGDIVLDVREMEIAPAVRLWRRTLRDRYSVLVIGQLPQVLTDSAAGRPLAQIVSHPALDALNLRIERHWIPCEYEYEDLVLPGIEGGKTAFELALFGKTVVNDR